MENGLLKSEPSFKEIEISGLIGPGFGWIMAYEHYLLLSIWQSKSGDCVIIDTRKDSHTNAKSGMGLEMNRNGPVYWKDGIFVCYGQNSLKAYQISLLHMVKNELGMTLKSETISINDPGCPKSLLPVQIHKDNLYVIEEGKETMDVFKYDLNARKWSKCEAKGEVPKARSFSANVLLEDKIYLFGGGINIGAGGLFSSSNMRPVNDLSVLGLENLKWQRLQQDNFLPFKDINSLKTRVISQKISITQQLHPGDYIYDPATNILQQPSQTPTEESYLKKYHEKHCILYQLAFKQNAFGKSCAIKYHHFEVTNDSNNSDATTTTKTGKHASQLSHMEMLWDEKPFADITFIVHGEEIQAHRIILLKCRYFQNMFKSGMIEANSTKINVPGEISVENFKAILEYIYLDKIALTESLALDLVVLADMYFLTKLKVDCEDYLSKNLSVKNFLSVLSAAEKADSEKLKEKMVSFLVENIHKVKEEVDVQKIPVEIWIQAILYKKK